MPQTFKWGIFAFPYNNQKKRFIDFQKSGGDGKKQSHSGVQYTGKGRPHKLPKDFKVKEVKKNPQEINHWTGGQHPAKPNKVVDLRSVPVRP